MILSIVLRRIDRSVSNREDRCTHLVTKLIQAFAFITLIISTIKLLDLSLSQGRKTGMVGLIKVGGYLTYTHVIHHQALPLDCIGED